MRHVALAGEAQLAVVLLVVDHVDQVGEHLAAVTTDEYVGAACKGEETGDSILIGGSIRKFQMISLLHKVNLQVQRVAKWS